MKFYKKKKKICFHLTNSFHIFLKWKVFFFFHYLNSEYNVFHSYCYWCLHTVWLYNQPEYSTDSLPYWPDWSLSPYLYFLLDALVWPTRKSASTPAISSTGSLAILISPSNLWCPEWGVAVSVRTKDLPNCAGTRWCGHHVQDITSCCRGVCGTLRPVPVPVLR